MLRELIKIFRSSDPLHEIGERFAEMLTIARDLTLKAGVIFFESKESPEERTWIYKQDVKVNVQVERTSKALYERDRAGAGTGL